MPPIDHPSDGLKKIDTRNLFLSHLTVEGLYLGANTVPPYKHFRHTMLSKRLNRQLTQFLTLTLSPFFYFIYFSLSPNLFYRQITSSFPTFLTSSNLNLYNSFIIVIKALLYLVCRSDERKNY